MKETLKKAYSFLPRAVARRIAKRAGDHLRIVDFSVLDMLRQAPREQLLDRAAFEAMLPRLGLCGGSMLFPFNDQDGFQDGSVINTRKYLGDFVIGLVRHGSSGWDDRLRNLVGGRMAS